MAGKTLIVLAILVAVLTAGPAACGGGDDEGSAVDVELSEQQNSGQSGTATLTSVGQGRTKVVVTLSNPPGVPQPAHIHPGSCDEIDPMPAYGLTNLRDGTSTTTVDASIEDLRSGRFAINVHKSDAEIQTYVACGGIG
jgi:hypothetical protein